jgi:hypothetical protein
VYIIHRIKLDVLQCNFLLQRLLVSRKFNGGQDLFDIAQEALSIIISLWLHRDQLQDVNYAFDWIVSCRSHGFMDLRVTNLFLGCIIWNALRGHFMH